VLPWPWASHQEQLVTEAVEVEAWLPEGPPEACSMVKCMEFILPLWFSQFFMQQGECIRSINVW
jgi:hypothetical protein